MNHQGLQQVLIKDLFTLTVRTAWLKQDKTSSTRKELKRQLTLEKNARILFNKECYNLWGIHFTSFGLYLVCTTPHYSREYQNALVLRISNNGRLEHEYTNNEKNEPLFSRPVNVCENRLNQNICVSDIDCKVIVLTSSGVTQAISPLYADHLLIHAESRVMNKETFQQQILIIM